MLRGIAYNVAHVFAGSCEHYANMACEHQVRNVEIDLLADDIEPIVFDIRRNRILAERCGRMLADQVARTIGIKLQAARLVLDSRFDEPADGMVDAFVTVTITDDRGKDWGGDRRLKAWWMPDTPGSGHYFA